jgi:hypothetical protein
VNEADQPEIVAKGRDQQLGKAVEELRKEALAKVPTIGSRGWVADKLNAWERVILMVLMLST